MSLVGPLPAALAAPFLFLVPGLVLLALLHARDRETLTLDEALYLAIGASVCASTWVGLVLAEIGCFSLVTAAVVLGTLSLVAVLLGWRQVGWPLAVRVSARALAGSALVLALAVGLQARPSEYLVGGRDPGAYIAAMGMIARGGGIVYTDEAVLSIPAADVELFYRNIDRPSWSWSRFMGFDLERPATGRVVPQFFHLFPVFGAYLFQAMGVKGALATPPVFAVLGCLGVLFAFRRILGQVPALAAATLLCLNVIQVWFGRYPVSETVSQFLLFLGLLALAHWERRGSNIFGALAGFAFGLTLLVRIDSVLLVAPLALYLGLRLLRGDLAPRRALALVVPFGLVAVHAAVHAAVFAPKYVRDIVDRPYWRFSLTLWAVMAVAVLVLAGGAYRYRDRARALVLAHGRALGAPAAGLVLLLAAYASTLRPVLSAWAGADGTDPASIPGAVGAWLAARWRPGLLDVLGYRRLAAHDAGAFLRLGWFLTPLGLAGGVFGLALMLRRFRDRYALLTMTALAFGLFYFYKIRVYNDYFFALRRFMPVVVPCLLGFGALWLWMLWQRGGWRRVAATSWLLVMSAAFVRQSLPLVGYTDWKNAVRFVDEVARRFGPQDIVVFEQPRSIHLLSLPLWSAHGVNVLELARFNPAPEQLQHLVDAWRERYRNIYFVHTYRTDLCGLFLQRVSDHAFGTYEWERSYGRAPRGPEFQSMRFTISRVVPPQDLQVPPLPLVDIGGSDDVQVSGFFDKDQEGGRTYRWSGSCGSIFVPAVTRPGRVVLALSTGRRPGPPPVSRISLNGTTLGTVTVMPGWAEYTLPLPAVLPAGPPVLRIDVPGWRPANTNPADSDTRDLGIQVDSVRFHGGPPT